MAYCVQADVEVASGGATKLAELTDDAPVAGASTLNATNLAAAIAEADAWIDSYLYVGEQYTLPLETVPELIKRTSAMETVFRLRMRRAHLGTDRSAELAREDRVRLLEAYVKGARRMPSTVTPATSAVVIEPDECEPTSREFYEGYA
jgi:phage gp36-like protein